MTIIAPSVSSTLYDYEWLAGAIAAWMHKNNLTGRIQDFIMLAEARAKALLEARFQVTTGTIVTVAGTRTAAWPSTLLRAKTLSIPGSSPNLDFVTMDQLNHMFDPATVGLPVVYSLTGSLIHFGPTPDAVYNVSYAAQMVIDPLTEAAPTNGLLAKWPNVYLWGALKEAAGYSRDFALEDRFDKSFLEAIGSINAVEWHSGGPLRMRSDVHPV